jgi:hypothetical protein
MGAARVYDDVRMAIKTGPDSIYIDGMEGEQAQVLTWPRKKPGFPESQPFVRHVKHSMIWVKGMKSPWFMPAVSETEEMSQRPWLWEQMLLPSGIQQ